MIPIESKRFEFTFQVPSIIELTLSNLFYTDILTEASRRKAAFLNKNNQYLQC